MSRTDHTAGLTRRRLLHATGGLLAVATAGCTGLLGDEPVSFEADPAIVPADVRDDTGYSLHDQTTDTVTRTYSVAGQERTVEVTNHIAEYDRAIQLGGMRFQAAVFTVLSTPQIDVLGRSFNPVRDMSNRELARELQHQYEEVSDISFRDEYTIPILDSQTTVGRYDANARLAGSADSLTVDIVLHVSDPIEAADEFVVCVGGYPTQIDDADAIMTLMQSVTITD